MKPLLDEMLTDDTGWVGYGNRAGKDDSSNKKAAGAPTPAAKLTNFK